MMKKIATLAFALMLTACNAPSNQTDLLIDQSQVNASSKTQDKNSLLGYNVNSGEANFVFAVSSNGNEISSTPIVRVSVKKLGVQLHTSRDINLVMPSGEFRGEVRIANDGNLYIENYGKDKFYKVGTWTKKDKFKGKGYIDLKDTKSKLFTQDFDIKLDSVISGIRANLNLLNPVVQKYVYFDASSEIKPVSKSTLNFDLSKFISTK